MAEIDYMSLMNKEPEPIHVTRRAIEWLTKSPVMYPTKDFYKEGLHAAACDATINSKAKYCSTPDIRAMYRDPVTVKHKDARWLTGNFPLVVTTCQMCQVHLDRAWENVCNKAENSGPNEYTNPRTYKDGDGLERYLIDGLLVNLRGL